MRESKPYKSGLEKFIEEHSQEHSVGRGTGFIPSQPVLKSGPLGGLLYGTTSPQENLRAQQMFQQFHQPTPYIATTTGTAGVAQQATAAVPYPVPETHAHTIYTVFKLGELWSIAAFRGNVVYCLEDNKFYKCVAVDRGLGVTTLRGNVTWKEIYVDPVSREIWDVIPNNTPEPAVDLNLTEEQEEKYQEFEKQLVLEATPGRLDQETNFEKTENDIKVKQDPGGGQSLVDDLIDNGAWVD